MNKRNAFFTVALAVMFTVALIVGCEKKPDQPLSSLSNTDIRYLFVRYLDAKDSPATATPVIIVHNSGTGNSLELRNGSETPVFYVDVDGNATYTGFSSGGGAVGDAVKITVPTAAATATAALAVNNLGSANVLVQLADGGSEVWRMNNAGDIVHTTGSLAMSAGNVSISVPTAVATATPAVEIKSAALGVALRIVDGASEVLRVENGGGIVSTVGDLTLTAGNLAMSAGAIAIVAPTAQPTTTP